MGGLRLCPISSFPHQACKSLGWSLESFFRLSLFQKKPQGEGSGERNAKTIEGVHIASLSLERPRNQSISPKPLLHLVAVFKTTHWLPEHPWWNKGLPGGSSGKEPAFRCWRYKRCGLNPWVRKIPWKRAWQTPPTFLPGGSQGQRSLAGYSP